MKSRIALFTITLVLGSVVSFAQGPAPAANAPDGLAGKYEGMIKGTTEEKVVLDLVSDAGKLSGRLMLGNVVMDVTEGSVENGAVSLSFGNQAMLKARVEGDKLVGDWSAGTEKRTIELKKTMATAASAPVNLNGAWEAVADANGQPFAFLLTLKIDGENVSGNSSSQLGEATITSGSWKEGRLSFVIEGPNGAISMSAAVVEGKLSGEFDFAGQLQGRWVAVKKN